MRSTHRIVHANGIDVALTEQGDGPAVVLCHGFPELGYSWRHQMPALAAAGFRAIAPDQRGYGDTTRPADVAAYDIHHLTGDLVGVLDALGVARAVFVGHDWGGLYVRAFERTGFTGGLNWYRNMDRNWETTPQLDGARIEVPSLMVTAEWDPVLRPEMAEAMPAYVPDLETVMIPACGHWTQQERPAELNRVITDWLRRRFGAQS